MIIKILIVLAITGLGMIGGQAHKYMRRYILPSVASFYTFFKRKRAKYKALYLLSLCGVLSMGYGESSWLRKKLGGSDFWTRIVYGALISVPFLLFGKWYAVIALPLAFSIHAGSIKLTDEYDLLFEDMLRYGTIGVLVVI